MNDLPRASSLFFSPTQCISLLQSYTRRRSIRSGKQLHSLLISSGLLTRHPLLLPALTSMYSLCSQLYEAHQLFDQIPEKTPFLYNVLIRGSVDIGRPGDALHLFTVMLSSPHRPNHLTFPFVLKACGDLCLLPTGTQIHCRAMVEGFGTDHYVQNCLISMYMNCHHKEAAMILFDQMYYCKSVVSWNTMIAGCLQNGLFEDAVAVFDRMVYSGIQFDQATLLVVIPASAELKDLRIGRRIHELAEVNAFVSFLPVRNALIDMHAKCGSLTSARTLFDEATFERDVICWTSMIGGYVYNGFAAEALVLWREMMLSDVRPNAMTVSSILTACGSLPSMAHGMCIHGFCVRIGIEFNYFVETALIDMYSKCGAMDLSSQMFTGSSRRTATWNAIISGFARIGMARDATEQLRRMLAEGAVPDLVTMTSLLPAYSSSTDLHQVNNIHGYLLKVGFLESNEVMTCLIDAYAKIGYLDTARGLFDAMPIKDFVSWSVIIAGYGTHGNAEQALWLFNQMVGSGVEPSLVTFTSVLNSCSHAGLINEGLHVFERMIAVHLLKPSMDHCVCIVDLLSRAGRLEEAYGLIKKLPFEANYAVWGALLGACLIHENVELGEVAANRLFEIQPENTGNYLLLGNIYASVGRWKEAEAVRKMVGARRLRKEIACSSIVHALGDTSILNDGDLT